MINKILEWIYPNRCLLCGEVLDIACDEYFCAECKEKIKPISENSCPRCGSLYLFGDDSLYDCPACSGKIFLFEKNIAAFEYDAYFREILHNIKYLGNTSKALKLGKISAEVLRDKLREYKDFHMIIPVPIHKNRIRKRGFNQAEIIARPISEMLNIPIETRGIKRTADSMPQSLAPRESRSKNVAGIFSAQENFIKGKDILLIDDIFTTGSTINSVCSELKTKGARRIVCVVCCISLYKENEV